MKLTNGGGSGEFQQAPAGTHVARCVKMTDLGTQQGEWQGKPIYRRQIVLSWELPNELMDDGRPYLISAFYTASLHEKSKLRAHLVNWRGREFTDAELMGFDSKNLLGKTCMLQLTTNANGKVRVTGVMSLPKGTACGDQVNESFFFSLEPDEFRQSDFDKLSDWYKDQIRFSPEWAHLNGGTPQEAISEIESDSPF